MGRRKIEIQPITHERNRSVTFLKRKNGLFKKAYELGVLCSVDVAVIIFEERPGHHVKLYQYCSTDVHNIVQRHLRFDGEKDTRTPIDFSNNKVEEVADDDDDVDEDEGVRPKVNGNGAVRPKSKSDTNGGVVRAVNVQNDISSLNIDLDYHGHSRGSPHSVGSNGSPTVLPVSGERHSTSSHNGVRGIPISNKRPRLAPMDHTADHLHGGQSAPANMNANSAGGGYPYRLDVDLGYPPSGHIASLSSSLPHAASHPSLSSLYPQHTNGMVNSHHHSQNPASFMSQQAPFDFPRHQVPSNLRGVAFPPHSTNQYTQQSHHHQSQQPNIFSQHRQSAANGHVPTSNMFVELLNSSEPPGQHQQSGFPSFDWPVHSNQQSQPSRHETVPPTQQSSADSVSVNNWLDFLSGSSSTHSAPSTSAPQTHTSPSPPFSLASQSGAPPGSIHQNGHINGSSHSHHHHHHSRPASNSVSSTRSIGSYAVQPPLSPSDSASPILSRKRSREADSGNGASEFEDGDISVIIGGAGPGSVVGGGAGGVDVVSVTRSGSLGVKSLDSGSPGALSADEHIRS